MSFEVICEVENVLESWMVNVMIEFFDKVGGVENVVEIFNVIDWIIECVLFDNLV